MKRKRPPEQRSRANRSFDRSSNFVPLAASRDTSIPFFIFIKSYGRLLWLILSIATVLPSTVFAQTPSSSIGPFAPAQEVPTSQPSDEALAPSRAQSRAFRFAMARVAPGVVTIETVGGTQVDPGGRGFRVADGPTTGLVFSADGLILTSSFNFVRDPSVITVVLPDGRRFVGKLLARDEVRRLAMLRIEAGGLAVPTWVTDKTGLRVGQWALALGRGSGGTDCSLTAGLISGLNRMGGLAIQTDAHLSPANFGGPLIDLDGRVLGLCVPMGLGDDPVAGAEWYDSGIGFAIPHWQVMVSADNLSEGHNLRRGLLGVVLKSTQDGHVLIAALADRAPALRAGLRMGDIITAIEGTAIHTYDDARRLLRTRYAGQWVILSIRREGENFDRRVILAVMEDIGAFLENNKNE